MYEELLMMNGYGQFVWPAFIFSFVSCFYLYLQTKSELRKKEKVYLLEFNKLDVRKIKFTKRKQSTEEVLPIN